MFLKLKTLREIKTSSLESGFCKVPCSLQYLKAMPNLVFSWGEGEERAIECVSGPPELSQDLSLYHPFGGS
jgi:hypothetical protein